MFEFLKRRKDMTQDEKDIEKAKEDIERKGADSQTEKDRIDESVAEQLKEQHDENSQSAKDRVDESEGLKKAEEKNDGSNYENRLSSIETKLDQVIKMFSERHERHEDALEDKREKYGLREEPYYRDRDEEITDEFVEEKLRLTK